MQKRSKKTSVASGVAWAAHRRRDNCSTQTQSLNPLIPFQKHQNSNRFKKRFLYCEHQSQLWSKAWNHFFDSMMIPYLSYLLATVSHSSLRVCLSPEGPFSCGGETISNHHVQQVHSARKKKIEKRWPRRHLPDNLASPANCVAVSKPFATKNSAILIDGGPRVPWSANFFSSLSSGNRLVLKILFQTVMAVNNQWPHLAICLIVHQVLAGHCSKQSARRAGGAIFLTPYFAVKAIEKKAKQQLDFRTSDVSSVHLLLCCARKRTPFRPASRNSDSTAGFTAPGRGFAKKGGRGSWIQLLWTDVDIV